MTARTFAARFAVAALLAASACTRTSTNATDSSGSSSNPASSTTPAAVATAVPTNSPAAAASAATAVPSATPSPSYTGPATLQRGDAPLTGRVVAYDTFVTCGGTSLTILATDRVFPHGSCTVSYDLELRRSASAAANATGPGKALVNGISVEGDTAIATYVRNGQTGQILLSRTSAGWVAKTAVSGALESSSAVTAGVDRSRFQRLQRALPFDVKATPLPALHQ